MSDPRRLRLCEPPQVPDLLPGALGGAYVLAPCPDAATAAMLRPELPVEEPDAAVVVTTSGSTGAPKGVVLARSALLASAAATRERLGGAMPWTLALPPQYVAGLMVAVRALASESPLSTAASDLHDLPADAAGAISIVPTQLVRALRTPEVLARLRRFDAVLLGGAGMAADVLAAARSAGLRIVTTYGMSETCGGCVYDGSPLPGVGIELDAAGRVTITGPTLFSGYRLRPDLTASMLVGGRLLTQDRARWEGGRLQILGRLDDVVVSGGVNVDLAALQAAVDALAHAHGLRPAAVASLPDPEWGARIALLAEQPGPDLAWWQDALREQLSRAALPRRLTPVPRLPRLASGKIDRAAVARLLQHPDESASDTGD